VSAAVYLTAATSICFSIFFGRCVTTHIKPVSPDCRVVPTVPIILRPCVNGMRYLTLTDYPTVSCTHAVHAA
jgi:hypothetical protein